jgi:dolichyl-phosphate-mannose--protein O-mannosyl transferase
MGKYHWGLKEGHSYGSDWWGWPVLQRPIWLFFEKPGPVHGIFCVGNPALFWTLPVSFYYAGRRWIENGDRLVVLAVVGFLSQWLPWMFIGRVKFFHYIYPAVPFGCLATALLLKALWARGLWGKAAASAYLALVAGMFAYWYPLLSGFPVSEAYYQNHLWFPSWI